MLYISAKDHARKLRFSNYVYLPSINEIFQYHYASVILCNVGEVIIFEHGLYISALEHIRMLILSSYVLLECMNTIYKIWSRLGDFTRCPQEHYIQCVQFAHFGMFFPIQAINTNY